MKVRCLIIDDEPPARELMTSYLSRLDDFEISAQFGNAVDAFAWLQAHEADLILLDIQMPKMNGLEFVKTLRLPPRVILTTAFREHAPEGFELDVLDYLVKPISFERFMKAIAKYHHYHKKNFLPEAKPDPYHNAYIFIKSDKQQVKILLPEILYLESIKDYLKVVTEKKTYIIYHRLSSMEMKLPENHFIRTHKSYIVSLDKIKSYRNEKIKVGNEEIPIGRIYKKRFLELFRSSS